MASKTRFQKSANGATNGVATTNPAVSKRSGNPAGTTAVSGQNLGPKSSNRIQVIYNGKIATPQSLIGRKVLPAAIPSGAGGNQRNAKSQKEGGNVPQQQTIQESVGPESTIAATPSHRPSSQAQMNMKSRNELGAKQSSIRLGGGAKNVLVEETCTVMLGETPTTILFSLPSLVGASDTRDVMVLDERNARYEEVVKAHGNADAFIHKPTQTKNLPTKSQNEMAAPNALRDFASQAVSYEITDATDSAYRQSSGTGYEDADPLGGNVPGPDTVDAAGLTGSVRKFVTETVGVALVTPGCLLDTAVVIKPPVAGTKTMGAATGKGMSGTGNGPNKSQAETPGQGSGVAAGQGSGVAAGAVGSSSSSSSSGGGSSSSGAQQSVGSSSDAGAGPGAAIGSSGGGANFNGGGSKVGNTTSGSGIGERSMNSLSNADNMDGGKSSRAEQQVAEVNSLEILREAEIDKILSSSMLLKQLQMVERAVQQNANHRSQLDYRDLPDIAPLSLVKEKGAATQEVSGLFGGLGGKGNTSAAKSAAPSSSSVADLLKRGQSNVGSGGSVGEKKGDDDDHSIRTGMGNPEFLLGGGGSKVKKLFSYSNRSLTLGRSVTAMVWNSASHDLLAVGYGKIDAVDDMHRVGEALDEERQGGLVLFWSLRNPDFPEKILRTNHPVSALDFSKLSPMILGVGLLNGDVNIYDVKREGASWSQPIETSAKMENGHSDPVWQLHWVVKGTERLETLVSISTDGSVLEWNIKKGLIVSSLMQLKKSGMGEGWISNTSAGLCLDFNPADPSTYVAGTEDGSIHRCSVSYNEQYLETYSGHDGPVQRVKFSQRWPSVFLSCSVDWSLHLYHLRSKTPLLSMRATGEDFAINDICWCPDNSTVFACVTVDAKLQVWDLSVSSIDPVVTVDCALDDDRDLELERARTAGAGEAGLDTEFDELAEGDSLLDGDAKAATALSRFERLDYTTGSKEPEDLTPPVAKLLKNLAQDSKKKVLTALQFGTKTPIIVVGDSHGTVTVYRVFDPVTITHQGPLQQSAKLQKAVVQQTDPENAALLESFDEGGGGGPRPTME